MQTFHQWQQSPQQGTIPAPTDWEREALADDLYLALEMLSKCHDYARKHGFKESRSELYTAISDAYNSVQEALQRIDDAIDD